jgi:hypothetical protein
MSSDHWSMESIDGTPAALCASSFGSTPTRLHSVAYLCAALRERERGRERERERERGRKGEG